MTVLLAVLLPLLFVLDVALGGTRLAAIGLTGDERELLLQIVTDLRLPRALTAVIAGAALAAAGLLMQTLFGNPLAGPYILGVSGGAMLGVGGLLLTGMAAGFTAGGFGLSAAAIVGATAVLLLVLWVSYRVESSVSLLITGMMFGSIAGALVSVMQTLADPDSLKLFVVWSLGSLGSVGWAEMPLLCGAGGAGLLCAFLLSKPLNGMLLGENYARGLGISVSRTRVLTVLTTGLLAGGVTAFCGPIAFVGVAVPHIARGLYRTSDHRIILPASALIGANLLLLCDFAANRFTYPLPISTMSSLFGAPIIIRIILKGRRH